MNNIFTTHYLPTSYFLIPAKPQWQGLSKTSLTDNCQYRLSSLWFGLVLLWLILLCWGWSRAWVPEPDQNSPSRSGPGLSLLITGRGSRSPHWARSSARLANTREKYNSSPGAWTRGGLGYLARETVLSAASVSQPRRPDWATTYPRPPDLTSDQTPDLTSDLSQDLTSDLTPHSRQLRPPSQSADLQWPAAFSQVEIVRENLSVKLTL